jgi:hypothetical protein
MPEKGVSGWGRVIPDWYILPISWPALYLDSVLDRGNAPAPLDVFAGFTVSFWLKPFIDSWSDSAIVGNYDDYNGIMVYQGIDYPREQGGWQIWWNSGWDRLAHLRFRWRYLRHGMWPTCATSSRSSASRSARGTRAPQQRAAGLVAGFRIREISWTWTPTTGTA